ncbi:MAG TPA: hypothetical protein VNR60_04995 [Croceibacterium sp.]|nr:hypothetical protein [Croceibacterium sp.]
MDKAFRPSATAAGHTDRKLDWRRKMSDHVAYALLVYTGLQIFVTMTVLKTGHGSALPYFALVVLIAAIIPGCRMFEKRWEGLSDSEAANPEFADRFKRDRLAIWASAIGLPLALTGLFLAIAELF